MVASSFSLLHADLPVCIGYQAMGRRVETRHCLLPARADSVSAARRFIRDVSEDWSPRPKRLELLLENLGIVVSELVTNALVHAFAAAGARTGVPASADRYGSDSYGSDLYDPDPGPRSLCLIPELCETGETGVERLVFTFA